MNLDWTVAIAIFLMFTAWSIIYYIDFSFRSGPWPCEPCDCESYPDDCP